MGCYVLSQVPQAAASSYEPLSEVHVVLGIKAGKGEGCELIVVGFLTVFSNSLASEASFAD